MKQIPFYPHCGAYAKEQGELDQYRASRTANLICLAQIEQVISRSRYNSSDYSVEKLISDWSYDRIAYLCANTIRLSDWDARYSNDNRDWANTIPIERNPSGYDSTVDLHIKGHPCFVDAFADKVRKYAEAERSAKTDG